MLKFIKFTDKKLSNSFEKAFLSGSLFNLDDLKFCLTISKEGLFLDEVDTDITTADERKRFIDLLIELAENSSKSVFALRESVLQYNLSIVNELKFKSDDNEDLFLVIEPDRVYKNLDSILSDDQVQKKLKLNKSSRQKLSRLLEDVIEESSDSVNHSEYEPVISSTSNDFISQSFEKIKEEKKQELTTKISNAESKLKKLNIDKAQIEKEISNSVNEISSLKTRLENFTQDITPLDYDFFVSEIQNEKADLEPSVLEKIHTAIKKVKSINADAFMKLFQVGEYHITIYKKNEIIPSKFEDLSEEAISKLVDMKVQFYKDYFIYFGEKDWHEIVDYLVKAGFNHLTEKK